MLGRVKSIAGKYSEGGTESAGGVLVCGGGGNEDGAGVCASSLDGLNKLTCLSGIATEAAGPFLSWV